MWSGKEYHLVQHWEIVNGIEVFPDLFRRHLHVSRQVSVHELIHVQHLKVLERALRKRRRRRKKKREIHRTFGRGSNGRRILVVPTGLFR